MKLESCIMRPGLVEEVLDNGKIKASAPGLFSDEDISLLPPIMPFFELMSPHKNSFSMPSVGDEIWVLNNTDNPMQLFWFRKDPHFDNNIDIFQETGQDNVEILCNRESGLGYASIYFSDGTGWIIRNDDARIQISADGTMLFDTGMPGGTMKLDMNGLTLGSGKHYACLGDEVSEVLMTICSILEALAKVAASNSCTAILVPPLLKISEVQSQLPGIISTQLKLD